MYTPTLRSGCIIRVPKGGTPLKPQEQPLRVSKMKSKKPQPQQERGEAPAKAGEKSIVISFRLSEADYEPYRESVEKSGQSRSQFFRTLFTENKHRVVISEKRTATEDYTRYLTLVAKISNNINQLARLLNGAEKSGKINSSQYLSGLNNLNSMRLLLLSKLGKKDKP